MATHASSIECGLRRESGILQAKTGLGVGAICLNSYFFNSKSELMQSG
jgi:hypothetical protein